MEVRHLDGVGAARGSAICAPGGGEQRTASLVWLQAAHFSAEQRLDEPLRIEGFDVLRAFRPGRRTSPAC